MPGCIPGIWHLFGRPPIPTQDRHTIHILESNRCPLPDSLLLAPFSDTKEAAERAPAGHIVAYIRVCITPRPATEKLRCIRMRDGSPQPAAMQLAMTAALMQSAVCSSELGPGRPLHRHDFILTDNHRRLAFGIAREQCPRMTRVEKA